MTLNLIRKSENGVAQVGVKKSTFLALKRSNVLAFMKSGVLALGKSNLLALTMSSVLLGSQEEQGVGLQEEQGLGLQEERVLVLKRSNFWGSGTSMSWFSRVLKKCGFSTLCKLLKGQWAVLPCPLSPEKSPGGLPGTS
jgi:hypothetical protein